MTGKMTHDALAMIEYRDAPAVLVLADSETGMARWRRSAESAGCRVSDAVGIEGAAERLDRQVAVDAVLVEIERDLPEGVRVVPYYDRAEFIGRMLANIAATCSIE